MLGKNSYYLFKLQIKGEFFEKGEAFLWGITQNLFICMFLSYFLLLNLNLESKFLKINVNIVEIQNPWFS